MSGRGNHTTSDFSLPLAEVCTYLNQPTPRVRRVCTRLGVGRQLVKGTFLIRSREVDKLEAHFGARVDPAGYPGWHTLAEVALLFGYNTVTELGVSVSSALLTRIRVVVTFDDEVLYNPRDTLFAAKDYRARKKAA